MSKKMIFSIVFLAVLVAGVLWWWSEPRVDKGPETTGLPMKVAKYYCPALFWVEIADRKGWFENAGLNVELVDTNPDWWESLVDTAKGELDTNNFPMFSVMDFNAKGSDLVMVMNTIVSLGVDGIVAKKEIKSIRDLKGKRIAFGKESYQGYMLEVVLAKNGMTMADVIPVDGQGEEIGPFIAGYESLHGTARSINNFLIDKGKIKKRLDSMEFPDSRFIHALKHSLQKEAL